ncbi:uncharacterized protein J4E78_003599 [Alternaria triticimaculans]|uniref:uncharacterized protein n=1 Tax=Alternaria triticimaculans TaxID=297637 RepID=UPI0020C4F289|nr:uncharacterized protein J4E78_003599 [Alternaria triticimaculans]KAI4666132.1 hypothetical protein J4E78_003599 [Alternaria triticimaculans]
MARTKREARRAPNSIAQHRRDIAAYYAGLVQDKNTPARRHALAYSSLPEETPIPVGFTGQIIEEAQKPQWRRDFEKASRITAAWQAGKATDDERCWLRVFFDREAKAEQEKLEQAAATEAKKQQWVLDGQRRHQGILSAGGDPVWTRRHLNRAFLGYGDKSDSDSDSVLSPSESDIDDPDSGRIPQDPPAVGKQPAVGATSTPTPEVVEEEIKTQITDAISSLTFEKGSDCPLWIGHLEKPLPHPHLTPLQNEHVLKRLYEDEIARLSALRDTRGPPAGHPPGGDWMYTSLYGQTQQVKEEPAESHRAAARGWWTYSVDGEDLEEVWEKWPVGLDGEPVGWRKVNWKDGTVGSSLVRNWLERELWALPEEDAMEGVEFE